jgi:hypothetical protein
LHKGINKILHLNFPFFVRHTRSCAHGVGGDQVSSRFNGNCSDHIRTTSSCAVRKETKRKVDWRVHTAHSTLSPHHVAGPEARVRFFNNVSQSEILNT